MKQAKFALTAVAVLAVVGGALAFKANRTAKNFFKYTTSVVNGQVTGICDANQSTLISYQTVAAGGVITTLSTAPATSVLTCTARVIPSL
jgi:hypothetical protein